MRNFNLAMVFLLAALAAYLLYRSGMPADPVKPPPVARATPQPTPLAPKVIPTKGGGFRPQPSPGATENPYAEQLEGNVIPFKVVDGAAIAFGDIYLGTPDEPEIDGGFFDAPTPGQWDSGEIPYHIQPDLPNPERVEKALDYLHRHSGVRFVPFNGQQDAIIFEKGNQHCYSLLGKVGGQQPISLSEGCGWSEILHETMHAMGFIHEQSRRDRDKYVEIKWDNIEKEYRDQFAIVPETFMRTIGDAPFDPRSVMMYRSDAFAKTPGLLTMVSKGGLLIDPVPEGLSDEDIRRLNKMFPR